MRLDRVPPRTRLLAVLAMLALLAWGLALAGMGSRVQPLPIDAGPLEPLSAVDTSAPPRLGQAGDSAQIAARPLFAHDRRPHPFFLEVQEAGQAEARAFDYVLTSVLLTPQAKLAILQPGDGGRPVRVRLDDELEAHPGWRLVGIAERSAVFAGPEGRYTLDLRVFDGTGGAPTPSMAPAPVPMMPTAAAPEPPAPAADQDRPQSIRQRIEARREALRREALEQASSGSR